MERMEISTVGALRKFLKNSREVFYTGSVNGSADHTVTFKANKGDFANSLKTLADSVEVNATFDSDMNIYVGRLVV